MKFKRIVHCDLKLENILLTNKKIQQDRLGKGKACMKTSYGYK